MAAQFARPHLHTRSNGPSQMAPNAALLIDFDNVTMGIRSDLSKELKNLLNSDIIKGKVAVQRAYADWRRYPQYIVSLAEASVDLIFAPAYGSAKKNATDIRLAIDALELVFTRPEIGTFILLSGDSDFSSLVLKLKEYGKYVIGVGIRESASDLLVQNCDEYYSYSVLSGLTKESDEERQRLDPWELVERAVRQMATRRDVMRSDRLKQVMLELDSNFNEKELGYSKFSRFLSDAVSRDRLRLKKGENGQWEVAPPLADSEVHAEETPRVESRPAREDTRESREPSVPREPREPRGRRGGRGRDHDRSNGDQPARGHREERTEVVEPRRQPVADVIVAEVAEAAKEPRTDLSAAYDLLRNAVENLAGKNSDAARDSDVKRRMLELHPGWDEATLGFSKFSRFLRQAHDAEVIDLHRGEGGTYHVALTSTRGRRQLIESLREASRRPLRETAPAKAAREVEPTVESAIEEAAPAKQAPVASTKRESPAPEKPVVAEPVKPEATPAAKQGAAAPVAKPAGSAAQAAPVTSATPVASTTAASAAAPRGIGARLGTRGRGAPMGPPPLLPGQAVITTEVARPEAPAEQAKAVQSKVEQAKVEQAKVAKPKAEKPKAEQARAATPAAPATPAGSLSERLGLPTDPEGVQTYILGRYKGVGQKTIATLVEAFGAADLFGALDAHPDRVREVLGGSRRADLVLDAWKADRKQRDGAGASADKRPVAKEPAAKEPVAKEPVAKEPADKKPTARKPATRRGGARAKAAAKADTKADAKADAKAAEPKAKAAPAARRGGRKPRKKEPAGN